MNSLILNNIKDLENQIRRELNKVPRSTDPYDECVAIGTVAHNEFNLGIKAIFKGIREPFFYVDRSFDQGDFYLSETVEVLQKHKLTLEDIKYFLERVLTLIRKSTLQDDNSDLIF